MIENSNNLHITNELPIVHVTKILQEAKNVIEDRQKGIPFGYVTRWRQTNQLLGGSLGFGQNLVIGARPGVGKSAYVNLLAFDIIELNPNIDTIILYWNFEMSAYRQGIRLISNKLSLSVNELMSAKHPLEKEAIENITAIIKTFQTKPLYFINVPVTVKKFYETVEQVQMKYPKHRIVNILDHTRLIKKENENKEEEKLNALMEVANEVKLKMNATNILLSQLNRNIESNERRAEYFKPLISDLFGSDSVGQFADTIFMLYRPEQYNLHNVEEYGKTIPAKDKIFNNIVKNRDGNLGLLIYNHNLKHNQITEYNGNN